MSLITVIIAQLSWRGWVHGLQALLRGEGLCGRPGKPDRAGVAADRRGPARADPRPRGRAPARATKTRLTWTPEALRAILHGELRGQEVIVVSNREPYIHVRRGRRDRVQRPASGLVTALEPIMRACSGTWIAHGSGSADRDVVDAHDRDRRAARTSRPTSCAASGSPPEEEAGYYYGFANEGLWPLCHIAHVRPTFRTADWEQYVKVNRRSPAPWSRRPTSPDPIVLVQDYHFALLPRDDPRGAARRDDHHLLAHPLAEPGGLRASAHGARSCSTGLLGSSILGFHTQFHCNNFVDTVDRLLEARVDRETFTVSYRGIAAPR